MFGGETDQPDSRVNDVYILDLENMVCQLMY